MHSLLCGKKQFSNDTYQQCLQGRSVSLKIVSANGYNFDAALLTKNQAILKKKYNITPYLVPAELLLISTALNAWVKKSKIAVWPLNIHNLKFIWTDPIQIREPIIQHFEAEFL